MTLLQPWFERRANPEDPSQPLNWAGLASFLGIDLGDPVGHVSPRMTEFVAGFAEFVAGTPHS